MEKKFAAFRTAEDFILDEAFQDWVRSPDREKDRSWVAFFEEYPEKKPFADEARAFLLAVEFPYELEGAEKRRIWAAVEGHILQAESEASEQWTGSRRKVRSMGYWIRTAAAVMSLLVVSFLVIYDQFFSRTTYRTAYGEITTIILPDSSLVTLNSNSELTMRKSFIGSEARELWLKGEGFFKVRRISRGNKRVKFIVHTTDLDVSVLGTSFNVYERQAGTEVTLQSGKVALALHADALNAGRGDIRLLMQPGEQVRYSKGKAGYEKTMVETAGRLSWLSKKLLMDDTPFSKVIQVLEENYGEEVALSDSTILEEKVTGELPLTDKDVFLKALSTTMQLHIKRDMENNRLVIERK